MADELNKNCDLVYFLTFEDPSILEAIDTHAENIFDYTILPNHIPAGKRMYIIIDEVQYANDSSNF